MSKTVNLDLRDRQFSPANAALLAAVCARAYTEHTSRAPDTGTDVLVLQQPEVNIVAFRGTSEIKDWITDLDATREHVGCGQVHAGFWRAWLSIKETLRTLTFEPKPIVVTGHSLGGALAQIAAKWFVSKSCFLHSCYTFGAPRLWNKQSAKSYNFILRSRTFNVVNAADPVPLLPPLTLGFRDAGTEIFLPPAGGFVRDPFIGLEILNDLGGMLNNYRKFRLGLLPNHFLARYQEKLEAL